MKLYIMCPENKGDGVYDLVAETGEPLAGHYCSRVRFAKGDLISNRPERIEEFTKRFGSFDVLFLGDDDMTKEKLIELNNQWYEEHKDEETK